MLGRPTLYTEEIARKILDLLLEGKSLRSICRADESLPAESTVRLWAFENRDGFGEQYSRAREIAYHSLADEIFDIADDGRNDWMESSDGEGGTAFKLNGEHVQRSKLRVETRKWFLAKVLPKVYGDKIVQEHTGPDGGPVKTVTRIERVIVTAKQEAEGAA